MVKRDFLYLKHTKNEINRKVREDKEQRLTQKRMAVQIQLEQKWRDDECEHKRLCKEAAKMTPAERVRNYFATFKGEYVGSGCSWDLLTKLGLK